MTERTFRANVRRLFVFCTLPLRVFPNVAPSRRLQPARFLKPRLLGCALTLIIAVAAVDRAGAGPVLPDKTHPIRLEFPGDPPAPPSVLAQRGQSPAARVVRGPFVSVQVNVNAMGNNVVGDAANEPSIAVDPTNRQLMAIGWRQFDTIASNFRQAGNAFTTDGGQTWTFPGVLDPGQFRSDPVLGSDAAGNFYYSSLSAIDSAEVFKSTDGGATWGVPASAFGGDKQWIAVDDTTSIGSGHVYQIWNVQFTCCGASDFTRSTNGGASFQGPFALPSPRMKWGTMDVGPDGTLYFAGATLGGSGHVFARSIDAKDATLNPSVEFIDVVNLGGTIRFGTGPNPGGLLGQVWIATDHSSGPTAGNLYILASSNPPGADPLDVMFIRSEDNGATWSAPVRVNDDAVGTNAWQWFGTMSVAPNGRIDVVWNDTRNSGVANLSELFYAFSTDGGVTWSANVPVSPQFDSFLGWPQQSKIGDYYHMVSDNAGANLAYAATFNGEQDVYFLRISVNCSPDLPGATDCNNNGIADVCDIADCPPGDVTCADCNGNDLPDECDLAMCPPPDITCQDCNANGVPDECEPDCDGNGVTDVCDCLPLSAPLPETTVVAKNRYLTFDTTGLGCATALRVTFADLHSPFDALHGQSMWVTAPEDISENGASRDPVPGFANFRASTLDCVPLFTDWGSGELHVYHEFIVPGSVYNVQAVDFGCDLSIEPSFSPALAVETSLFGDTVVDCSTFPCGPPNGGVDIVDAVAILNRFVSAPGAIIKSRADLDPAVPDQVINITDVLASLKAFVGLPYPFSPSAFPCE